MVIGVGADTSLLLAGSFGHGWCRKVAQEGVVVVVVGVKDVVMPCDASATTTRDIASHHFESFASKVRKVLFSRPNKSALRA
jgi:hypothetical protein